MRIVCKIHHSISICALPFVFTCFAGDAGYANMLLHCASPPCAGKKWFLQPGLQAEEGSTVRQSDMGWDRRVFSKVVDNSIARSDLVACQASTVMVSRVTAKMPICQNTVSLLQRQLSSVECNQFCDVLIWFWSGDPVCWG
jgi:hypothetical protein